MTSKTLILFNPQSGSDTQEKTLYKAFKRLIPDGKIDRFDAASYKKFLATALKEGFQTIVAAGGDGTVSAIASELIRQKSRARLGIIPVGTLNHFAQDLGIPASVYKALDIIARGKSAYVDAAKVNTFYFLNNSSLGFYPYIISERDQIKSRGIKKWWRVTRAVVRALRRYPYVRVTFESNGKKFTRETPFIFVGNNVYEMGIQNLGTRRHLKEGVLSVLIAHKVSRMRLIILVWHALRGTLKQQRDFDSVGLSKLTISARRKRLKVSYDGEIALLKTPIHYESKPRALRVIIP